MRRTVAGLANLFDAPFINKNVMHSNRLRLMDSIWPDALFIEVRRDVVDNARSIIRAERANGGPKKCGDEWWSVRPRLAEQYAGTSEAQRAVTQVIGVGRDITEDMTSLGQDRLLSIDYTNLCASPGTTLDVIAGFLGERGCSPMKRFAIPGRFSRRPSTPLSEEDEQDIARARSVLSSP
jgi:hypothetical protein